MALKPCLECGHQISTKAISCPNCSHPNTVNFEEVARDQVPKIKKVGMVSPRNERLTPMKLQEKFLGLERRLCNDLKYPDFNRQERALLKKILKVTRKSLRALHNGSLAVEEGKELFSELSRVHIEGTTRIPVWERTRSVKGN